MSYFLEGFLLQASLIFALGAQNLFVLESGLKRRKHLHVALICALCDTLLIAVGVAGAASVFVRVPHLKIAFGVLGVAFLLYYGVKKLWEAYRPVVDDHRVTTGRMTLKKIVLLTLSFSLLNPHVYLDAVVLIGGYSAKYGLIGQRLKFGAGAAGFSTLWFFSVAIGASYLNKFLSNPRAMRLIAFVSGLVLVGLSLKLGHDVNAWLLNLGTP